MKACGVGFLLLGLLVSCSDPTSQTGFGAVSVTVSSGTSRSVVPDFTSSVDSYSITMTSHDGFSAKAGSATLASPNITFSSVEAGTWDIIVHGLKASVIVGTGALSNQTLAPGGALSCSIPVLFSQSGGTGSLALTVTLPASTGIDYVEGTIAGSTLTPTFSLSSDQLTKTATFAKSGIPSGVQRLVMTFKRGGASGTIAGSFGEAVNIWDNVTSGKWIDGSGNLASVRPFSATDFFSSNASLSGLGLSEGLVSFSSGTLAYDAGSVNSTAYNFVCSQSVNGQDIQYQLNAEGWNEYVTGTASPTLTIGAGTSVLSVKVTAPDAQTVQTYTVNLTLNPAKSITSFSFSSPLATGSIDDVAHTIGITVPYGTSLTSLVPSFTTTGANVSAGGTAQVSGSTSHDFTSPVVYTVAAYDSTTADYTVTVSVAPPGTGGVSVTGSLPGDFSVTFGLTGSATIAAPDTTGYYPVYIIPPSALPLTISVTSTPTADTYKWIMDGTTLQTGSSANLVVSTLTVKNHYLTLMLKKGGDPYRSASIILTVGN